MKPSRNRWIIGGFVVLFGTSIWWGAQSPPPPPRIDTPLPSGGAVSAPLASNGSPVASLATPADAIPPILPLDSLASSHPVEAAVARGMILDVEVRAGLTRNEYIRTRLVQSPVQPRPVRVVEHWKLGADRRSLHATKREMFLADQLIVQTRPGISPDAVRAQLAGTGMRIVETLGDRLQIIRLPRADLRAIPEGLARVAELRDLVESAEPDGVGFGGAFPNDPFFTDQWGFHNILPTTGTAGADVDAPEFWNALEGTPGVVIAVLDSGLNFTHPDLQDIAWSNPGETPGDGIDNDANGRIDDIVGWDFVNNDNLPVDDHEHGSHVTGLIAATRGNGIGMAGMLRGPRIMVCKVLNANNGGTTSNLIAAVAYARVKGAPIMNLSLQSYPYSKALENELAACDAAGVLLAICAGNQGSDNDISPNYPSSYPHPNIVAVGNHDRYDAPYFGPSASTNFGAKSVDLFAPGRDIFSTVLGSRYSTLSGTSMATPFVTSACAALKFLHPAWSVAEIKSRVMVSTVFRKSYEDLCVSGGRLNAFHALFDIPPDIDTEKPSLLGAVVRVTARRATLKGVALDDSGISSVQFRAGPGGFRDARGTARWTVSAPFPKTKRVMVVKVRAFDTFGNRSAILRHRVVRP